MKPLKKIKFSVISLFPESLDSYLKTSILNRAAKNRLIEIKFFNIRDFLKDKKERVDERPYGGGAGMAFKPEPIFRAVSRAKGRGSNKKTRIILFSTRGGVFSSKTACRLASYNHLILICGRYEGVDERVARYLADEEVSIGDFILAGGELPALVLIEAIGRQIPGVLGKKESLEEVKGSYPVYTRPEIFVAKNGKKLKVPAVLLSGNHRKISAWRKDGVGGEEFCPVRAEVRRQAGELRRLSFKTSKSKTIFTPF